MAGLKTYFEQVPVSMVKNMATLAISEAVANDSTIPKDTTEKLTDEVQFRPAGGRKS